MEEVYKETEGTFKLGLIGKGEFVSVETHKPSSAKTLMESWIGELREGLWPEIGRPLMQTLAIVVLCIIQKIYG